MKKWSKAFSDFIFNNKEFIWGTTTYDNKEKEHDFFT